MQLQNKVDILVELGVFLTSDEDTLHTAIRQAKYINPWFTGANVQTSFKNLQSAFLNHEVLKNFIQYYHLNDNAPITQKTVGIVCAGNLPLVGFHDFLITFLTGHNILLKLSEKDTILFELVLDFINSKTKDNSQKIEAVGRLQNFDAVIATGSNNTARYFEQYFGKYPNIIRKNRNSIAILDGEETAEQMRALGNDIFNYFGLGCRNVSKIYVPKGYDFIPLLDELSTFNEVILHHKYKNNYDYMYASFLVNTTPHFTTGALLVTENDNIGSQISVLNYSYYDNLEILQEDITQQKENIQCIASNVRLSSLETVGLGKTQSPTIFDYADNIDTAQFLLNL